MAPLATLPHLTITNVIIVVCKRLEDLSEVFLPAYIGHEVNDTSELHTLTVTSQLIFTDALTVTSQLTFTHTLTVTSQLTLLTPSLSHPNSLLLTPSLSHKFVNGHTIYHGMETACESEGVGSEGVGVGEAQKLMMG